MPRGILPIAVAMLAAMSLAGPALAEDGKSGASAGDSGGSGGKPGGGSKFADQMSGMPRRLASTLVGTVGGIPVWFVKKSAEATMDGVKDICGQSTNPVFTVPAGIFTLPFGVLSGGLQAPVVSMYNAWTTSGDEPFSKASFGLGDKD